MTSKIIRNHLRNLRIAKNYTKTLNEETQKLNIIYFEHPHPRDVIVREM